MKPREEIDAVIFVAVALAVVTVVFGVHLRRVETRLDQLEQRPAVVQHTTVTRDVSAPRATRSDPRAPRPVRDGLNWTALAQCESSGRADAVSPTGKYRGAFQADATFWRRYGGLAFAPRPDLATYAEQLVVARRGYAVQGRGAWPTCGVRL